MNKDKSRKMNDEGELTLVLSMMYGGKTSYIMHIIESLGRATKCLYINHSCDTRSTKSFSTHNRLFDIESLSEKLNADMIKVSKLANVPYDVLSKYKVICVDEGQFFEDLNTLIRHWVEDLCKEVYVAALSGDYKRENFGQVHLLFPFANKVEMLRDTLCEPCSKRGKRKIALFTKRIADTSGEQIEVGNDNYIPVCRTCYKTNIKSASMDSVNLSSLFGGYDLGDIKYKIGRAGDYIRDE